MKLEKAFKHLLVTNPFYGLFLLGMPKKVSEEVDTACVRRKGINCELIINPKFWETLPDTAQLAVLTHEVYHVVFQHMFLTESFKDKERFNIAADMEVNSYIEGLPEGCVRASMLGLEDKMGTKFYYEFISPTQNQGGQGQAGMNQSPNGDGSQDDNDSSGQNNQGSGSGQGKYKKIDDHSNWDKDFQSASSAEKQLIQNQINGQIKVAAEQVMKTRGTIPAELQEIVNELFKPKVRLFDWKSYFRRMLGSIYDINIKKTRRKESVRFEGNAGIKHKKKVSILVAVDTSGSISNKELTDFFSEITHIYKTGARITILECDAAIHANYEFNGKWNGKVTGRGGTNFQPPINYYRKHRHDYSALVYFTDGECSMPVGVPNNVIWVITSKGKVKDYPGRTLYIPKEA